MNKLDLLRPELERPLGDIADLMPPQYRVTLICRHTELPNAEIILTDDDLLLVGEALSNNNGSEGNKDPLPNQPKEGL